MFKFKCWAALTQRMKVLLTGASGRVGRAVYVRLSRSHTVVGLDAAPSSTADWVGDILDQSLLD